MGKKLAIKGDKERGNEVIALLEMLGGYADELIDNGIDEKYAYFIVKDENNVIDAFPIVNKNGFDFDTRIFTLEEFLERYPFKVGNVIKFPNNMAEEIAEMKWDEELEDVIYTSVSGWTRPSLVPKNINNKTKIESTGFMQLGKTVAVIFNDANYEDEVELQLGDYEIVVRDGKTYAVRKKPVYPKTYAECCEVLVGRKPKPNEISFDKMELCLVDLDNTQSIDFQTPQLFQLNDLFKLLMCRKAYWKIAGEEMGLDKPWDSVYGCGEWGYWIGYDINANKIYCQDSRILLNHLLVFPSEEMRDAFYNNFKDIIEKCKELL